MPFFYTFELCCMKIFRARLDRNPNHILQGFKFDFFVYLVLVLAL